jgi:hypothetical protein
MAGIILFEMMQYWMAINSMLVGYWANPLCSWFSGSLFYLYDGESLCRVAVTPWMIAMPVRHRTPTPIQF